MHCWIRNDLSRSILRTRVFPQLAEAVEKVGGHSSRLVLPQQSKLGGSMFEPLLRHSVCWRINLSPRTPRNTFSTASANNGLFGTVPRTSALPPIADVAAVGRESPKLTRLGHWEDLSQPILVAPTDRHGCLGIARILELTGALAIEKGRTTAPVIGSTKC